MSIAILASVTTFGLFAFMAFLISSDQVILAQARDVIPIDIAQTPDDSKVVEKPRPIIEPPKPPPEMPRNNLPPEIAQVDTSFNYKHIDLTVSDTGSELNLLKGPRDSEARPIVRVNPKYPMDAARKGIEGWVVLGFDISAIGEVVNIKIIDSVPKRVFDKAAKQALRKWKYRAKSLDGNAISQHNFTVQLDFNMAQNIKS